MFDNTTVAVNNKVIEVRNQNSVPQKSLFTDKDYLYEPMQFGIVHLLLQQPGPTVADAHVWTFLTFAKIPEFWPK